MWLDEGILLAKYFTFIYEQVVYLAQTSDQLVGAQVVHM